MTAITPTTVRPGERAPVSGRYEMLTASSTATGTMRFVGAGQPMPPTPHTGFKYALREEFRVSYTTVASAAVLQEASTTFSTALANLAKK